MLTIKELQYVDLWANKIPMPGEEYSLNILKEMKKCYELYNQRYKDKSFDIILSNGEEVNFEIMSKNLCHMLGIDFTNIKGDYFNRYRKEVFGDSANNFNSYDLVELILDNMDKVARMDNEPTNQAKAINYYKSSIKCEIFQKLSDFDKFNFAVIRNARPDDKVSKFLFMPSNEGLTPYFMMGLVKDETPDTSIDTYAVSTLLAPQNPKEYFDGTEAMIPTQLLISDNNQLTKIEATAEEKIQLLTMYQNIINKYSIPNMLNIYGDYENMLNEMSKQKTYVK